MDETTLLCYDWVQSVFVERSMGYSVSVVFSSSQERDQALDFLNQHLDWTELQHQHPQWAYIEPVKGEHLKYPPKHRPDRVLGFNGGVGNLLCYDLCSFLAVRSAHRNHKKQPVVYHDREPVALVVGELQPGQVCVDEQGRRLRPRKNLRETLGLMMMGMHGEQKDIDRLLQTLAERWLVTPHTKPKIR